MSDKMYKCKNCGAQVTNIIDNIGRCEHCGSPYEIVSERKEKNTVIINSEILNSYNISEIKNNLSEDLFERNALATIVACPDTPTDVFDSAFGSPEMYNSYYAVINTQTRVEFFAEIGKEHRITEWEDERYYDMHTRSYQTRRVSKDRWITDWHPYHGIFNYSKQTIVKLDDSSESNIDFGACLDNLSQGDVFTPKEDQRTILPKKADIDRAIEIAESRASNQYESSIPEMKHRYERIEHIDTRVQSVKVYITPVYSLKFHDGERVSRVECFGNDLNTMTISNVVNQEKDEQIKSQQQKQLQKRKPIKVLFFMSLIALCILATLEMFLFVMLIRLHLLFWEY